MRMTFEHKDLTDFLSVPDGTYYPVKVTPGSAHQVKEIPDKDGFLPLCPTFKKEDIPQHRLLKENPDGSLYSDAGDVFRPNYQLAKSDADFALLLEQHFMKAQQIDGATDKTLFIKDVLRPDVKKLLKRIQKTELNKISDARERLRAYQKFLEITHETVNSSEKPPRGAAKYFALLHWVLMKEHPDHFKPFRKRDDSLDFDAKAIKAYCKNHYQGISEGTFYKAFIGIDDRHSEYSINGGKYDINSVAKYVQFGAFKTYSDEIIRELSEIFQS